MASDVKVKITLTKPIGRLGFGMPLLLETNAAKNIAYTLCSGVDDVEKAGFGKDTNTYKTANLIFMQENAPGSIAVEATTLDGADWLGFENNINRSWRQIMFTQNDLNTDEEAATLVPIIETIDGKIGFFSVPLGATLEGVTIKDLKRSFVFFCDAPSDGGLPVGALVGATAAFDPGSFTYKNLILKGITPQNDSYIEQVHSLGGVTFVTKAGDNVTSEGKVLGGEYLDIIDSEDYVVQQIEYRTQKLLNTTLKVPYTDAGITMLENVCETVLKECWLSGMISTTEDGVGDYSVSYAMREETDENDRVVRKYILGQFKFALAGAIHEVEINGEITI